MAQTAANVTIIPAKTRAEQSGEKYKQLRVAAYCRVSTEQEEQQNSYEVQISCYTDLINGKREWSLAGIFADEGIRRHPDEQAHGIQPHDSPLQEKNLIL